LDNRVIGLGIDGLTIDQLPPIMGIHSYVDCVEVDVQKLLDCGNNPAMTSDAWT
jgi:hypothetical protein